MEIGDNEEYLFDSSRNVVGTGIWKSICTKKFHNALIRRRIIRQFAVVVMAKKLPIVVEMRLQNYYDDELHSSHEVVQNEIVRVKRGFFFFQFNAE